jgi:putative ABC transport system substrate-binding protein
MVRGVLTTLAITAALWSVLGLAGQSAPTHRIGALMPSFVNSPYEAALVEGLRGLGYVDGKNIAIEWRRFTGEDKQLRALARELAQSKVEMIVALNTPAARAALEATTLPVVYLSGDPVATGLAENLAKPGGRGTGVSIVLTELTTKRLDLLHQLAPRARRIVYLTNLSNPIGPAQLEVAQKTARQLNVQLIPLKAANEKELDAALRTIAKHTGDGFAVTSDVLFYANRARIARAVRAAKLPAAFPSREYHEEGALMSYGVNSEDVGKKLAGYVVKVLTGTQPGDLPIEQLSQYEFVLNLHVARELGLDVPQDLLLRADAIIR